MLRRLLLNAKNMGKIPMVIYNVWNSNSTTIYCDDMSQFQWPTSASDPEIDAKMYSNYRKYEPIIVEHGNLCTLSPMFNAYTTDIRVGFYGQRTYTIKSSTTVLPFTGSKYDI